MNILQKYIENINLKRPLYMPYLTIGDPTAEATEEFALALIDAGADILELGIPFSDPTADGPVIEAAMVRSLSQNKFSMESIFKTVDKIHKARPEIPIVFLGYLNPILHYKSNVITGKTDTISSEASIESFMKRCSSAGVQGIVIPDLPFDQPESRYFKTYGKKYDVSLIMMIAPNTKNKRMKEIAEISEGFIYYVTSMGVTGERNELPADIRQKINQIRKLSGVPVFAGFGISKPEHVRMLKKDVQGIIVGSLNHTIIQEYGNSSSEKLKEITSNFLQELKK